MKLEIEILNNGVVKPKYATEGSAAFDLVASEDMKFFADERQLVKTGLYAKIPEGYELQVRSRSGMAFHHGVVVLNSPGTIDSDYRGEIGVLLMNFTDRPYEVKKGDRIAQAVLAPVVQATFKMVNAISETERGQGGFGSTGR